MTDHFDHSYDDGHGHDYDAGEPDLGQHDVPFDNGHDDGGHDGWDDHDTGHDAGPPPEHDDPHLTPDAGHVTDADDAPPAELDIPALPDLTDDPVDVFPPALDIGELPEPVDGFPWIDPAGLGTAGHDDTTAPVRAEELAEYAGTDLPDGADGWQVLANSDDPATSALARWWSQD